MSRRGYIIGFVVVASMITYKDLKGCGQLPWPPRFVATGLVFSLLDIMGASETLSPLSAVMAVGFVIAMVISTLDKSGSFQLLGDCGSFQTASTSGQVQLSKFNASAKAGIGALPQPPSYGSFADPTGQAYKNDPNAVNAVKGTQH